MPSYNYNPPQFRNQMPTSGSGLDFEAARKRREQRELQAKTQAQQKAMAAFPTQAPAPVQKSLQEKILSFTGGNILGRGLGLGIAQGGTKQTMDEIQQGEGEMQQRLIEAIRKNRAIGKDTTKLEASLKALTGGIAETGDNANDLYTEGITNKQVVGDALQLGTTVGTIGALPGAAKSAVVKPGIVKGAIAGAKTGAKLGAATGAATGFAQGLKKDKSIADSFRESFETAIVGGLTGSVIGGVTGGVSGGLKSIKAGKSSTHLEAITPKTSELTPTEYEKLLSRGKILPKTARHPARYVLSDDEVATATKYKHLLSSNDPVKNTINVVEEISRQDEEVGKFLQKNNAIFNSNQLKKSIISKLDDVSDITVDEARLANAKAELAENFVKSLKKKDMHSLWQARKAFDQQIDRAFTGAPTLQNRIKVEFRNAVQDFIAEKTPNSTYKDFMQDMSKLFNVKDVLTTKAAKEKTYNKITLWIKHNPNWAKVIGWGAGLVGAGAATSVVLD